jgi:hypothetical protein
MTPGVACTARSSMISAVNVAPAPLKILKLGAKAEPWCR